MPTPEVTVIIPTIPARKNILRRAVDSVRAQTQQPLALEIAIDRHREGSAATRNRALSRVQTEWVAFLDDDDYFLPVHIEALLEAAEQTMAEVIYSGCRVIDRNEEEIPLREDWGRYGQKFDGDLLMKKSYIPVTSLCRTDLAQDARFGPPNFAPASLYDDWGFYTRMFALGAAFFHLEQVTWVWHHHGYNTSGQPDRW